MTVLGTCQLVGSLVTRLKLQHRTPIVHFMLQIRCTDGLWCGHCPVPLLVGALIPQGIVVVYCCTGDADFPITVLGLFYVALQCGVCQGH